MKKIVSFLLAVLVALGVATFSACSKPGTGNASEVNAQEYMAALTLNGNFKFVMTVNDGAEQVTTTFAKDGNKLEMKNVQGSIVDQIFVEKDGDKYFLYAKTNDEWFKSPAIEDTYNYYLAFPLTAIQVYVAMPFEQFTYDANGKCYVMTQSGEGMSGTFKISFENKKVKKIETSVLHLSDGESITTQIDFTYDYKITLPSVGGNESTSGDMLTAENYDEIMTLSAFDCIIHGEMTGDMEGKTDHVYNKDIVSQRLLDGKTIVDEMFVAKVGDKYYDYEYSEEKQSWFALEIDKESYEDMRRGNDLNYLFNFEDWTYNAQLDRYECAEKTMNYGGMNILYLNTWLKIENGKVVAFGTTNQGPDQYGGVGTVYYNYTVEYTKVELTLPEAEQY